MDDIFLTVFYSLNVVNVVSATLFGQILLLRPSKYRAQTLAALKTQNAWFTK